MSEITTSRLIESFVTLGGELLEPSEELTSLIDREAQFNAWFTRDNVLKAVNAIGNMLNLHDLTLWLTSADAPVNERARHANADFTGKKIGLVLAGNIPMVGFHDVLCVLASGNYAMIKASSNDSRLIPYVLNRLAAIEPAFLGRFGFVDRLKDFDAVMATGSNNTSRYFEYYFKNVPHIIRKNRNSLALISGFETNEHYEALGHDIFDYFGLGCRSISKLLVPDEFDFGPMFRAIERFSPIINHHKYNNNYDYIKSIYLVNREAHLDNGFLILKQSEKLASPLAVVYYDYYKDLDEASEKIIAQKEEIQCVTSSMHLQLPVQLVDFGESQQPRLWDYADGINTMHFLSQL